MTDPLEVKAGERGVVRVFTTDLEPEGDAAIVPKNVGKLLGDGIMTDPAKIEVFPARMLDTLGITNYLHEGYGIPHEAMAGKAAVLNALSGLIVLVSSSAFRGKAVSLDPNPALRFIGAFAEEPSAAPRRMAHHDSAEGHVVPDHLKPDVTNNPHRIASWIIALGAIILAAALVLFVVF